MSDITIRRLLDHTSGLQGEPPNRQPLAYSHYTIKDGKISKVQVYTGDQHGVDRYFWAMYDLKPIPDRLGTHDMSKAEDPNTPFRTDKA